MAQQYFALDGNYGDADGLLVIDTTDWTEAMDDEISCASDNHRAGLAEHFQEADHNFEAGICMTCELSKDDLGL
jgi:hypothetical protein